MAKREDEVQPVEHPADVVEVESPLPPVEPPVEPPDVPVDLVTELHPMAEIPPELHPVVPPVDPEVAERQAHIDDLQHQLDEAKHVARRKIIDGDRALLLTGLDEHAEQLEAELARVRGDKPKTEE